ncbi:MAG: hypothetical protein LBH44_05110 [Treponema sp.]|jgi:flagellar basal body rod protein FlgF|nr:hypothetical protein [Treponema sp.]
MEKKIIFSILFIISLNIYGDENLLDDYRRLYIDLLNVRTHGYKSFFNETINRSSENINLSQGSIQETKVPTDFAIIGEGFLKIRLENDLAGYTRAGNFLINSEGTIVIPNYGYPLYDSLCLKEFFIYESIKITSDFTIYVDSTSENERIKTKVGKILLYKIPAEFLEHYKDAIYVIKEGVDYEEEIVHENTKIFQNFLEMSNFNFRKIVLRMYFILTVLNENIIPNIEFKKELLRLYIENMAENNSAKDMLIFEIYKRINDIFDEIKNNDKIKGFYNNEYVILKYLEDIYNYGYNYGYIEMILPYIKYDY